VYNLKNKHIKQLDVFRALAALSVCAVHFTYNSFFHNYLAQGLFVQLFFTLSGFVIAYNYHENLNNLKEFYDFVFKRFKRLYPLHFFFLIIFLILEIFKYILVLKFDFQSNNIPFSFNNLKNFMMNLLFVQHFANEQSFNGPSWSISVEMMLYLTFGLTFLIFKKKLFIIFLNILYIIFFIFFMSSEYGKNSSIYAFYSGLYSFSIGCLFYFIFKKINNFYKPKIYHDVIFYILVLMFLLEIFNFNFIKQNYLYSIIFGAIFFYSCFLNTSFLLFKIFFNNFFIFLGKISYSIYMSHLAIFFIFDNFLKHLFKYETIIDDGKIILNLSTFEANVFTLLIYILVIIFSSLSYKFVEMKFYKK